MIRPNKIETKYRKRILTTMPIAIVLLIVGWFSFNTMWLKDTMMYQFFCNADDSVYPIIHISSLSMIWESQVNHYFTTNGRFFCHFLVQLFSGLLPHWVFQIMNIIVWGLLLYAIIRLSEVRMNFRSLSVCSILTCSCLIFLPFDPAFSINYVWMGTMNLYFILLFVRTIDTATRNFSVYILLGIFSCLSGQGHESFSLPISIAILTTFIRSGFRFNIGQWVMAVCYGIGAVTVGLAPGVFARLGDAGQPSLMHGFERICPYLILPIILLILSVNKKHRDVIYSGKIARFILVCMLVNIILSVILISNFAARMMIFTNICSVILICRGFKDTDPSKLFVALCYGVFICISYIAIKHQLLINSKYDHILTEYHRSDNGKVYLSNDEYFYDQSDAWTLRIGIVTNEQYRNPEKPEIRIYPESLKGIIFPKDSNIIMKVGEQSWILLQSNMHPRDFFIRKRIRIFGKEMSPRKVQFGRNSDIFVDSLATHTIVAYRNDRPYLESRIEIK